MEKKRWSLILMGLCLALVFSVSSVEAEETSKCNKDGDNYVKARPSSCLDLLLDEDRDFIGIDCDDNNIDVGACEPDDRPCETPNVRVGWVNMGAVSEDSTRLCVPAMIQEQGTDGSYTCATGGMASGEVTFSLDSMSLEEISKQGNEEVCAYFEENGVGSFIPSRVYGLSWAGPCLVEDPCLIRINMWSHMTTNGQDGGDPIIYDPDGSPGTGDEIELGFTRVMARAFPVENSCNPFTVLRDGEPATPFLEIEEISIRVQRPGNSHKVMADCQWPNPEGPDPDDLMIPLFSIVPD